MNRDCLDIQVGAGIQAKIPPLPTNNHTVDCVFMFIARQKRYLLLAHSRSELDSWLDCLNNARSKPASTKSEKVYPTSAPTQ